MAHSTHTHTHSDSVYDHTAIPLLKVCDFQWRDHTLYDGHIDAMTWFRNQASVRHMCMLGLGSGMIGSNRVRYTEFRDAIVETLSQQVVGLTWQQLRDQLKLPYDRPCPEWTKRLEEEVDLVRIKGTGRALIWKLA